MTENIIIDGVDVSGCEKQGETIAGITCGNGERIRFANEIITKHKLCKDNHNCNYKQLKRKEQECEKLKTQILSLQTMEIEELKNYKQSLDEIKEIMKKYCRKCKKHKFYHFKLCYTCKYTDILQKISECEVENAR